MSVSENGSKREGAGMAGSRRQGREAALQAVYLADICHQKVAELPPAAWSSEPLMPKTNLFALHLAQGVVTSQKSIDALLKKYAENWDLDRMAVIDRCILRIGTFELLNDFETPVNVIINEAVEIAKRYSTAESSKFVNGILDKVKLERKAAS